MATPAPTAEIPCCSPATTESVAVVRDKVADTRADLLMGQGAILKSQGDYTSAILRDANANTLAINASADRGFTGVMSQADKYGLANLNATHAEAGLLGVQVDRVSSDLSRDVTGGTFKVTDQANTIAWAQENGAARRVEGVRDLIERTNDFQSATSDRAFKHLTAQHVDSFARLAAQGENGFYRTGQAVAATDKQVVQSEIGLGRAVSAADKQVVQSEISVSKSLNAGFSDVGATLRDSYARLSEQNCDLKSAIAAAQAAAAECCCEVKQEVLRSSKELGLQAAQNFGVIQMEESKNTGAIQLQAAVNQKDSFLEQSKWFALAEKTAMVNKCELEAKMAACCCEIKEAVTGTASATQALIQATESTRIRDALSAAATENAILKLRREEHHHYPPYPYHHHGGGSRRGSRG